jgi:curved DNA-binding protein
MGGEFPDYYELLQVDPDCDARILEIAYHYFAKMYHPDNPETADFDRFNQIVEAYRVLRDPQKRAEYDRSCFGDKAESAYRFALHNDLGIDENTAVDDGEMHARILMHLYDKRRTKPSEPGIAGWLLQEKLGCTEDRFEFHVWYLKSKGYIELTEQGTLAVTAGGVDHVISMSRSTMAEKRLITKLRETGG